MSLLEWITWSTIFVGVLTALLKQVFSYLLTTRREKYDHELELASMAREEEKQALLQTQKHIRTMEATANELSRINLSYILQNDNLRAELREMRALVARMAVNGKGTGATIVSNSEGIIVEWSPAATLLLHYTQEDILGRPITDLIPGRYIESHQKGWERVKLMRVMPETTRTYDVHAKRKEGTEVAVRISLSAWLMGGRWTFAAELKEREETESGASPLILPGENPGN